MRYRLDDGRPGAFHRCDERANQVIRSEIAERFAAAKVD
jgi:hypothetical protein